MESNAFTATSQYNAALTLLAADNAPRALLVSLDHQGQLALSPVGNSESLLDIEADLQNHLNEQPMSTEWLLNLRDYIDCRLAARAEARRTGGISIARKNGFDIAHIATLEFVEDVEMTLQ